ncbi:MAG: hypothetical protein ACREAA_01005 [Candidatus Polarisedimenticolia bacterium]
MHAATGSPVPEGTRGPQDDFFCYKYQVWYRVADCVYRGQHKTFPGCVNCFQGLLNIRSREKRANTASREPGGTLLTIKR